MCGIAGLYNAHSINEKLKEEAESMLSIIQHRGPDEFGLYFDENIAFGTSRLSIIDLISGSQPIMSPDKRYCIAYNGETYNFLELRKELQSDGITFHTNTDTEVVLQTYLRWGLDGVNRLNGAFAFAIYDKFENTIKLVRDRFGQRPLYYHFNGKDLYFASEIKCFLANQAISLELDNDSIASTFYSWGTLSDRSVFKGIDQVPNGCQLEFKDSSISVKQWYTIDFSQPKFEGTFDEAKEITYEKVREATKLRLTSDVEVGTYLSGGLDSTITTGLAQELTDRTLNTFSISFEESEFDENQYQKIGADIFGTNHHVLRVDNIDIAKHFKEALWHAETPVFRTALVPMLLLSRFVKDHKIKVVLTGEGADESFLGYNIFKETIFRSSFGVLNEKEKLENISRLYPYLNHFTEKNAKMLVSLFENHTNQDDLLFSHRMRFQNSIFSLRSLKESINQEKVLEYYIMKYSESFSQLSTIERAQWLEFHTLLSGYLLSSQGDRAALANGVENRAPFLDVNVVEWALKLPTEMKLSKEWNEKYILKKAFNKLTPKEILRRNKQPYRAPDVSPFISHYHEIEYLREMITDESIKEITLFNSKFVSNFLNKIFAADKNHVSPRNSQTFLFILSVIFLNDLFCKNGYKSMLLPKKGSVNVIDGRNSP